MKLAITVQNGTLAGKMLELTEGFLTVGRGANCNLIFNPTSENMVSTKHAYIEAKPDGFYLIDNKSTNGTFVNGNRIQVTKLNSADVIQFGKNGPEAKVFIEVQGSQQQQSAPPFVLSTPPVQPVIPRQSSPQFSPPPSSSSEVRETNPQQMQPTQAGNNWEQPQQFQTPQPTGNLATPPPNMRNSFSSIGLGNPEAGLKPNRTGTYLGLAAAFIIGFFLLLIVTGLVLVEVGPVVGVLAALVAFIPAAIYILPLMGLDRYDPEPPWLLALAFAWGGLVSIVISYFINTGVGAIASIATGSADVGSLVGAVISAPVFEEGSKGFGLLLILIFFRKYFDDILDGIVYAGVIALGFATVENIFYYGREFAGNGLYGLVIIFFIRGILSPFAHVTFTSMTGIGCGISRESHNGFVRFIMPIFGYVCAVCLHALWNGMTIIVLLLIKGSGSEGVCEAVGMGGSSIGKCSFYLGYGIVEVPLFFIFVGFAIYVMRRQNRILKEMLALDVARGVIPQEHLNISTSVFRSIAWVYGSIFSGKFGARSKYLRAVGKLGLSYWHIQRATAAHGNTASFQQNPILRDEVLKWRDQV